MTKPSRYFSPQAPATDDAPAFTQFERGGTSAEKPAGSSPALRIPCPVCAAPPGAYCMKGHGKIQVIAHKRRREQEEATR
jgi:hypothetical protein